MTLVLSLPARDLDLGPTFEAMVAFGQMGRLEPGDEYAELMGVATADEPVDRRTEAAISAQASRFLRVHGEDLDPHARWILGELASA